MYSIYSICSKQRTVRDSKGKVACHLFRKLRFGIVSSHWSDSLRNRFLVSFYQDSLNTSKDKFTLMSYRDAAISEIFAD